MLPAREVNADTKIDGMIETNVKRDKDENRREKRILEKS